MNDTELDEILNQWKDPQVRTAWSTEVRSGLLRKPVRRTFGQWAAGLWPGFGIENPCGRRIISRT